MPAAIIPPRASLPRGLGASPWCRRWPSSPPRASLPQHGATPPRRQPRRPYPSAAPPCRHSPIPRRYRRSGDRGRPPRRHPSSRTTALPCLAAAHPSPGCTGGRARATGGLCRLEAPLPHQVPVPASDLFRDFGDVRGTYGPNAHSVI
ncbi:hypothetical protein BS78_10G220700 [Paspalum vaginatum]|nr:hypothetical protein BS78_10G220700 [Paspalum vaginatum]KAJ1260288.1 hypothetical protein BS78_10G220700 [Paspalum vaginatum]